MVKIENDCVGPCPQGCMGAGCPYRHARHYFCDECEEECSPSELYAYNGRMLCEECLLAQFDKIG